MHVKATLTGLAVYSALAAFCEAILLVRREKRIRLGRGLGWMASAVLATALAARAVRLNQAPLQNMFEVFLFMAACIAPFSWLCRPRCSNAGEDAAEGDTGEAMDYALGALLLVPAGFVFPEAPRLLPPALRSALFIPHVTAYLASYLILTRAAWRAFPVWGRRLEGAPAHRREREVHRLTLAGYPLLTLGLVLGAWWGKRAWGDFWNWDPKELWALATWLVYTAALHDRAAGGARNPRRMAAWMIAGWIGIVLTLTWVNVSRVFGGLHSYAN